MEKVTAGHDALGEFAPEFARLNDDVLFGEVWSREEQLSPRDRSIVTIVALMSGGILDSSLKFHLEKAKENGITRERNCRDNHSCLHFIWVGQRRGRHLIWRKRFGSRIGGLFMKGLVLYYSYSGNTEKVAKMIQRATGFDIAEIKPVKNYEGDYNSVVNQGKKGSRQPV